MQNGIVRTFDADKGYGWIIPSDGIESLFVHWSNYESRTNDKGLEAINVSLMK